MMNKLISAFFILTVCACNDSHQETTITALEKDLIPEGIAISENSGQIYLSSLNKEKLVSFSLKDHNPTELINSNQYGFLSGFGMIIRGDTLYALSNSLPKQNNHSTLLLLHLKTGQLIDRYDTAIAPYGYLNDLAISKENEIYITESESNKIFVINRPAKNLRLFMDSPAVANSNGIAISEDNKRLFLASRNGICIVDVGTKKILNEPDSASAGIDGMKFYQNSLIGMRENGLYRYFLNNDLTAIKKTVRLIHFDSTFKSPTTFAISGNSIYFIKNTQLGNFNDITKEVIDQRKLGSLILYRKVINDR